eukprot:14485290-Heterocapsa_arctica.AAC.1
MQIFAPAQRHLTASDEAQRHEGLQGNQGSRTSCGVRCLAVPYTPVPYPYTPIPAEVLLHREVHTWQGARDATAAAKAHFVFK